MDEAAARKIIEDYLVGQSSETDLEKALDYLKTSLEVSPNLSALYRDLELPGGLSHEAAQEIMPYYLEPLARAQLSHSERDRFAAHLSQCQDCAVVYLELRGFEAEVSRFRQTEPVTTSATARPWPVLQPILQSLAATAKLLRYTLTFSPVKTFDFRETNSVGYLRVESNTPDELAEYSVLFEDTLGEDAPDWLEATVTAWRSSPATCDLQVELVDRLEQGRQAGQKLYLSHSGQQFLQKTNAKGEAVFFGLDIAKLVPLKLEFEIKP